MTAGERAAMIMLDRLGEIARAVTDAMYRENPGLLARYGERGRAKCLQDMRYNLEHLAPAVELDDPPCFVRYVAWCDDLLRSRGVPTRDLARSLELMEGELRARLAQDEADAAAVSLRAGLAALRPRAAA
ncbi:MAG TPA: hypothetical protein VEY93_15085 [Longimicrobium sp.]|nr:hypothetical protein [Longimicrobium sp.]